MDKKKLAFSFLPLEEIHWVAQNFFKHVDWFSSKQMKISTSVIPLGILAVKGHTLCAVHNSTER